MSDRPPTAGDARRVAAIPTPHASRYLQQLCKHFAHRRPVSFDAAAGRIAFATGTCTLAADAGTLTLSLTAPDAAAMAQLEDVVARHLVRFAFRETLPFDWRVA